VTELWYEAAGEGSALVLVHAGICDARMWDAVWPALTERHRVVQLDLRGFGRSGPSHGRVSPRGDLVSVLDATGIERAALCGVSYGGAIGLELALSHPERVSALVLVCCAVDWSEAPAQLVQRIQEADSVGESGGVERAVELELQIWVDGDGRVEPVDPAVRERVRDMNRGVWELALASEGEVDRLDPPPAARLGEVRVPTLVIAGGHDQPFMRESCRAIANAIPGAQFELIEGVAHLPPLEQPDVFARLLIDFLASSEP
jgi:3-oxoadipate enol-lactonase